MTREAAEQIALALEILAAAARETGRQFDQPQAPRVKLAAAAAACGIPSSTLRELCARRVITATRTGRTWMVRLSDVETYMQRNTQQARGQRPRITVAAH